MNKIPIADLLTKFPQYTHLEEIAEGGYKTVYRATMQPGVEALKVVSIPDGSQSDDHQLFRDECIGRVRREVSILEKCSSPYMVKTASLELEPITHNGQDFVVYSEEFLEGSDLWSLVRANATPPSENEVKQLFTCLLECIKELWSMKVIHRDIKPCNVIRLPDLDRPFVLIDLGIAFALQDVALTFNATNRNQDFVMNISCFHVALTFNATNRNPMATFRYIAPEQCDTRNRANLDYRADLYSAALTLFEYATGEHPIARNSDDAIQTVTRALMEPPKKLIDLRPDFSAEFCKLINQLLNKRPALRPANLNALINQMT